MTTEASTATGRTPVSAPLNGLGGHTADDERVASIEGWITQKQARLLGRLAADLPAGTTVIEIGAFRGKSTAALTLAADESVDVITVDPHNGVDRGPNETRPAHELGDEDHRALHANLARLGLDDRVTHLRCTSDEASERTPARAELVFVDGSHRMKQASVDVRVWRGRVAPGGYLAVHDAFSSIAVTWAILRYLALSRRFRYLGREGSLALYRRDSATAGQRVASTLRQLAALGPFARIVAIKIALRACTLAGRRDLEHAHWPH